MENKELTKAEEQVMQFLWKVNKGFLKDIVDQFPVPKPAYTTVSTVIRVLVKKGFIGYNTYGKIHEYYPLVSKGDYFQNHVKSIITNYFVFHYFTVIQLFIDLYPNFKVRFTPVPFYLKLQKRYHDK